MDDDSQVYFLSIAHEYSLYNEVNMLKCLYTYRLLCSVCIEYILCADVFGGYFNYCKTLPIPVLDINTTSIPTLVLRKSSNIWLAKCQFRTKYEEI